MSWDLCILKHHSDFLDISLEWWLVTISKGLLHTHTCVCIYIWYIHISYIVWLNVPSSSCCIYNMVWWYKLHHVPCTISRQQDCRLTCRMRFRDRLRLADCREVACGRFQQQMASGFWYVSICLLWVVFCGACLFQMATSENLTSWFQTGRLIISPISLLPEPFCQRRFWRVGRDETSLIILRRLRWRSLSFWGGNLQTLGLVNRLSFWPWRR